MSVPNGERPLPHHQLFVTGDLDEARERIACVYQPHKLTYATWGQQISASFRRAPVSAGITLNLLRYGADVVIEPGALENFYLAQIPLSGQCEIRHQGRSFITGKATASIISPSQPVTMRWGGDCDQLMLQIDRRALGKFIERTYRIPIHDPLIFDPELPLESRCGAGLNNLLLFIAKEIDRGGALATIPAVADQLAATVMSLLSVSQPHNYLAALALERSAIAPAALKRAIDFMQANLSQPITLAEIVQASGVSMRSLFDTFHRFRNCTPMADLKNRRLKRARSELSAGRTTSVTAVALACGFNHFGNFAADYKRLYGENPSQTLRHAIARRN